MLKSIDPIITAPLLGALLEMGHGDELVIVDTNFPTYSVGRRVVEMPSITATRVLEAILSLFPLDDFLDSPAATMLPRAPEEARVIFDEFQTVCSVAEGRPIVIEQVERFAFYERAKKAYVVIRSGERRLYGNIILTKGVIRLGA